MSLKHMPPEYNTHAQMKGRCFNPKHVHFADYGGRGITVCERWLKFANFLEDMGPRPTPKHTLERRDNDGDYEPGNVRWATKKEQAFNRRNNRRVIYDGKAWLVSELAAHVGLAPGTLDHRLKSGWGVQRAISTPSAGRPVPGQLEYEGRKWTIKALAAHIGMDVNMLKARLHNGWDVKKAVETPKMRAIMRPTNA